jgi:hypothetical protein
VWNGLDVEEYLVESEYDTDDYSSRALSTARKWEETSFTDLDFFSKATMGHLPQPSELLELSEIKELSQSAPAKVSPKASAESPRIKQKPSQDSTHNLEEVLLEESSPKVPQKRIPKALPIVRRSSDIGPPSPKPESSPKIQKTQSTRLVRQPAFTGEESDDSYDESDDESIESDSDEAVGEPTIESLYNRIYVQVPDRVSQLRVLSQAKTNLNLLLVANSDTGLGEDKVLLTHVLRATLQREANKIKALQKDNEFLRSRIKIERIHHRLLQKKIETTIALEQSVQESDNS